MLSGLSRESVRDNILKAHCKDSSSLCGGLVGGPYPYAQGLQASPTPSVGQLIPSQGSAHSGATCLPVVGEWHGLHQRVLIIRL